MVSKASATSCAPLLLMDLCRVSVWRMRQWVYVEVRGRAAGRVRKERVRSAKCTRWVRAASAGRKRTCLIETMPCGTCFPEAAPRLRRQPCGTLEPVGW